MILDCPDERSFRKITDEILIGDGPIDALEKYLTKNRTLDEIQPRVLTKGENVRVTIEIIPIVLPDRITM